MPPLTAFSTLACPQWSVETVIRQAAAFGYDGLEWRGGPQGHINPASSPAERLKLRQSSADAGLAALAVTAYTSFVSPEPSVLAAQVADLYAYADLAHDIGARFVRAFLGQLPPGETPSEPLYDRMARSLASAAEHAAALGVSIAVEPHDDFVLSDRILPLLARVSHPALAVIWDLGNTWAAGEDPADSYRCLAGRLAYVQVKDGRGRGDSWQLCSIGSGDVPLAQAVSLLQSGGYAGAYSLEWEWAWHPELEPPEIALPAGLAKLRDLLVKSSREGM